MFDAGDDRPDDDARTRRCRALWRDLRIRGRALGLADARGSAVRTPSATFVAVEHDGRVACALTEADAVVSVVAYELRELTEVRP